MLCLYDEQRFLSCKSSLEIVALSYCSETIRVSNVRPSMPWRAIQFQIVKHSFFDVFDKSIYTLQTLLTNYASLP